MFADANGDFELPGRGEAQHVQPRPRARDAARRRRERRRQGQGKDAKGRTRARTRCALFVLADADALSDAAFSNEPNILLFVDAIRWLGGEESFTGALSTTEDVKIEHTKQKDLVWFYGTIFARSLAGPRPRSWCWAGDREESRPRGGTLMAARALFVHGALLLVSGGVAVSVWTRDKAPQAASEGEVTVWSGRAADVGAHRLRSQGEEGRPRGKIGRERPLVSPARTNANPRRPLRPVTAAPRKPRRRRRRGRR